MQQALRLQGHPSGRAMLVGPPPVQDLDADSRPGCPLCFLRSRSCDFQAGQNNLFASSADDAES